MKALKDAISNMLSLVLLGSLILFIVITIQTIAGETPVAERQEPTPVVSSAKEIAITLTLEAVTPYPLPSESWLSVALTDANLPYVPPYIDISQSTPVVVGHETWEPTSIPTPWEFIYPTFTPFPSPTLRPGPTDTPLPLVEAAQDASGVIRYMVVGEVGTAALVSQPVDAFGLAESAYVEQILSEGFPMYRGGYPSPDGSYLAVLNYWEGGIEGTLIDAEDGHIIHFSPSLNDGEILDWFPDSQRILMRSYDGRLRLADPITGEHIILAVPDYGVIYGGAASPDGKQVVYSYFRKLDSFYWQVRIVNSDGRDDHVLFETSNAPFYFAWSPDGRKIVFLADGWIVVNADGSDLRHLTPISSTAGCLFNPVSWSPDSRSLAIVSSSEGMPSCSAWIDELVGHTDIYLVEVESGEAHPLLPDGIQGNFDSAWSPDGKQIAFVSTRSGAPELWVVNADGSNLRQLTSSGQPVRFPSWSRQ